MKKLLRTIEYPDYIKKVQLSKQRRATYYKKGSKKKLPKKYEGLKYNSKGFLVHKDGTKVVANSKSVGTPRYKKINGQEIYSGMSHYTRAKIVNAIKKFFMNGLKKVPSITEGPVQIEMELHDEIGVGNWDLDNLWIYNKCFQDALFDSKVLPDDSIMYITKPAAPEFFPIKEGETPKMVFKIYKDDRKIITNNKLYAAQFKEESW